MVASEDRKMPPINRTDPERAPLGVAVYSRELMAEVPDDATCPNAR